MRKMSANFISRGAFHCADSAHRVVRQVMPVVQSLIFNPDTKEQHEDEAKICSDHDTREQQTGNSCAYANCN